MVAVRQKFKVNYFRRGVLLEVNKPVYLPLMREMQEHADKIEADMFELHSYYEGAAFPGRLKRVQRKGSAWTNMVVTN